MVYLTSAEILNVLLHSEFKKNLFNGYLTSRYAVEVITGQ